MSDKHESIFEGESGFEQKLREIQDKTDRLGELQGMSKGLEEGSGGAAFKDFLNTFALLCSLTLLAEKMSDETDNGTEAFNLLLNGYTEATRIKVQAEIDTMRPLLERLEPGKVDEIAAKVNRDIEKGVDTIRHIWMGLIQDCNEVKGNNED